MNLGKTAGNESGLVASDFAIGSILDSIDPFAAYNVYYFWTGDDFPSSTIFE